MSMGHQPQQPFQAGDIVYTLYGAGVIVSTDSQSNSLESAGTEVGHDRFAVEQRPTPNNNEPWYAVRLWRLPNRSVGSSALAKLRSSVVCLSLHRTQFVDCIDMLVLTCKFIP
jgi:hypothetical protein